MAHVLTEEKLLVGGPLLPLLAVLHHLPLHFRAAPPAARRRRQGRLVTGGETIAGGVEYTAGWGRRKAVEIGPTWHAAATPLWGPPARPQLLPATLVLNEI
jgi:hypothetical protein